MTTDEEKAMLKSYQTARLEGDEEKANRLREEVEEGLKRLDNAEPYKK